MDKSLCGYIFILSMFTDFPSLSYFLMRLDLTGLFSVTQKLVLASPGKQ